MKPIDALSAAVAAMEARDPVPAHAAAAVIAAWRRYLAGDTLDAAFRIKVRQGGRYETPRALERFRRRDALIVELWNANQGNKTARARQVAAALAGRTTLDDARLAGVVAQLQREFQAELPTSAKQIGRIADGEGIHHRRTA